MHHALQLWLVSAVVLAIRLEARVIGSLQIVLNDARGAVDRADLEVFVQYLVAVLPTGRKLQFLVERLEVVVGQVGIDDERVGLQNPWSTIRVVKNEDRLARLVALVG